MSANKRMERLASALSGALQLGDRQADQVIELSRINGRQRRVLWRAFHLIKRGRHVDALAALETECSELRDRESAR
jgi:hypothetical protein